MSKSFAFDLKALEVFNQKQYVTRQEEGADKRFLLILASDAKARPLIDHTCQMASPKKTQVHTVVDVNIAVVVVSLGVCQGSAFHITKQGFLKIVY